MFLSFWVLFLFPPFTGNINIKTVFNQICNYISSIQIFAFTLTLLILCSFFNPSMGCLQSHLTLLNRKESIMQCKLVQCKQCWICRELASRNNLLWEKDAVQVTKQPMRVERLKIPSHSRPFSPPIIWLASHFFPISAVTWIWAGWPWSAEVGNGEQGQTIWRGAGGAGP